MKKSMILTLFLAAVLISTNANAQLFKFGLRAQTDIQGKTIPLHNFSIGPEVDLTVPLVGVGVTGSVMFSFRYLDSKEKIMNGEHTDLADDLYNYLYIPINVKWKLGLSILGVVVQAGPYFLLPMGSGIKDAYNNYNPEKPMESIMDAAALGLNIQVGVDFLKHYRVSLGYKGDVLQGKVDDISHHTKGAYLDMVYFF